MKTRVVALAAIFAAAAMLSGCASPITDSEESTTAGPSAGSLELYTVAIPNSKAVDCVASKYTGSMVIPDCDWANVRAASSVNSDDSGTLESYTVKGDDGQEVVCVASKYTGSVIAPDCNWAIESNR